MLSMPLFALFVTPVQLASRDYHKQDPLSKPAIEALQLIQSVPMKSYTLPETNIAPENRPSQKETSLPTINFQLQTFNVSFRGGVWFSGFSGAICCPSCTKHLPSYHYHSLIAPRGHHKHHNQSQRLVQCQGHAMDFYETNHQLLDFFVPKVSRVLDSIESYMKC